MFLEHEERHDHLVESDKVRRTTVSFRIAQGPEDSWAPWLRARAELAKSLQRALPPTAPLTSCSYIHEGHGFGTSHVARLGSLEFTIESERFSRRGEHGRVATTSGCIPWHPRIHADGTFHARSTKVGGRQTIPQEPRISKETVTIGLPDYWRIPWSTNYKEGRSTSGQRGGQVKKAGERQAWLTARETRMSQKHGTT